jgi:23S rRNA (uridine2552-2'-O)-methyltransferase
MYYFNDSRGSTKTKKTESQSMPASHGLNRWDDHYSQKARKENYPARSVYKLQEIQQKLRLIRNGHHVLDLGCAPGAWLKYAAELTGPSGRVVGIDLKPITIPLSGHVQTYVADILNLDATISDAIGFDFHIVMSDMAPSTTGQKTVDAARSLELSQAALQIAKDRLVSGGSFICKIFQSEDFKPFAEQLKPLFHAQKIFKPQSCRKASREIYLIGYGKE